ncbi:MAG: anthranilate/aminodeoxychorismate synthase component II [Deltaproteobacteria bacterium GWC2_42_11]|nr:MAG: anthranilate/aminodeoxychorismate synthase component II [Deltaproteobacteria bacterium GWC2_42_11]
MLLMIDNYDSFTYNLVQYLAELGEDVRVYRNDKITVKEIEGLKPDRIVISPGPCDPQKAGISVEAIKTFVGKIPILGVCLGHQSIGYAYGGEIVRAKKLMHGKTSKIYHDGETIFEGIENPFDATRYHSLVIRKETLPDCLEISAWTEDEEIMGIRYKEKGQGSGVRGQGENILEGVQFHPESILTKSGKDILKNFLDISKHKEKS